MLEEILARLNRLEPEVANEVISTALATTKNMLWVPNTGPQTEAYFTEADELFYGGCVSGDTQYLSPEGWKDISNYSGGLVAQWKDGVLIYVIPDRYIDTPCSELIHFSHRRLSMVLSPEHRMLLYDYQRQSIVKLAKELEEHPSRYNVPVNFICEGAGLGLSDSFLRLHIAIQADGNLTIRKNKPGSYCRISLRKKRKIERLEALLKDCNIAWHEYHNPNRPTEVRYGFEWGGENKHFEGIWWQASSAEMAIILDEMSHWDGAFSGAKGGDICFNTSCKNDADYMQFVAHACGRLATIGIVEHTNRKWSTGYRVNITRDIKEHGVSLRVDGTKIERVKASRMYCFNVPSSFFIARHNNKIFVTGNSAGGGKSDLMLGLALNEHKKSLILRRTNKEAEGLNVRIAEIVGNKDAYHSQKNSWVFEDRTIEISGCQLEDDKQKFKGNPRDGYFFDEISDFSESQYVFITGWNRSVDQNQRCRIVAAGNPPTRPEGLWVMKRWGAWLDRRHPNPAKPGELRWYTTNEEGEEIEVPCGTNNARSRTFIPAKLSDNPDLARTNYAAVLDSLPKELRDAYRDGNFNAALKDNAFQTIPTEWVMQAITRWTDKPPANVPMCCIGVDIAQGGNDQTVAAARYDGWFAPLAKCPGKEMTNGAKAAGFVTSIRRDNAKVIVDMGGGYGGACYEWLKDNSIDVVSYKGAEGSSTRTADRQLTFRNKRSQCYWQFREALDPGQPGGSPIFLPDDSRLIAGLCAPTFVVGPQGIEIEKKVDVVKRLGWSPDEADAVIMAWSTGNKASNIENGWPKGGRRKTPNVIMGYSSTRRK